MKTVYNETSEFREDFPRLMTSEGITLWLFNIAMENGPFIDDFPIEPSIYNGFSMAMLNNQMVPRSSSKKTSIVS